MPSSATPDIPGYTYGTDAVAKSPISVEEWLTSLGVVYEGIF